MDIDLFKGLGLFAFGVMLGWFLGLWGFLVVVALLLFMLIPTEREE